MIEINSNDLYNILLNMSRSGEHHDKIIQVYNILSKNIDIDSNNIKRIQEVLMGSKEYSRALSNEVKDYVDTIEGKFSTVDLYKNLNLSTREEQKHAVVIIGRLIKDGIIERIPDRSGYYRKIDNELKIMDWASVEIAEVYMRFPLGVENYVHIYPKNVILINGSPNSGKTALSLELARLNRNLYDIPTRYISTEMGEGELKTRLNLYPENIIQLDSWARDIQFIERSSDFADIILPDGITILDYLEVYDEFYKTARIIADIHKKLHEGVAIIVIQKDPNKIFGVGGSMNNWKPRLSMNLDKGMITLTKVKNFRGGVNPDGLYRYFEIEDGWKFKPLGDWTK